MSNEIDPADVDTNWTLLIPEEVHRMDDESRIRITEWCRQNFSGKWSHYNHCCYLIELEEDILLFKIRWRVLGKDGK